jgi:hypothetical protein
MINHYRYISLLLIPVMLLVACTGKRISEEGPAQTSDTLSLAIPESEIVADIRYPTNELAIIIERVLSGVFLDAKYAVNEKGDSLHLTLKRNKKVEVEWHNGELWISSGLNAKATYFLNRKRIKLSNPEPVETDINISIHSSVSLSPDFRLTTVSTLEGFEFIKEPVLRTGFLSIKLAPLISPKLEEMAPDLLNHLDDALKNAIKIKPAIQKIWCTLNKPIRINKQEQNIWLLLQSNTLRAGPVNSHKDTITLRLKTKTLARVFPAGKIKPNDCQDLPPLKYAIVKDSITHLNLRAEVPFEVVNDYMERKFRGQRISGYSTTITIHSLNMYGGTEGPVLELETRGDVEGRLFLKGVPVFNNETRKLSIENMAFDLHSENLLAQVANDLFHDQVIKELQQLLSIPLGELIDRIPQLIEEGIEKGDAGKKINTRVSRLNLKVIQQKTSRDKFEMIISTNCKLGIELEKEIIDKQLKPLRIRTKKQRA